MWNGSESNGLQRKLGRSISVDSSNLAKAAAPPDGNDQVAAAGTGTHRRLRRERKTLGRSPRATTL